MTVLYWSNCVSYFFGLQVKTWAKLLNTFCTNGKLELELIYKVQMQCYEDAKLMKLFPEIVRSLYDQDVLAEDTILHWFRKRTNQKGRYLSLLNLHCWNMRFFMINGIFLWSIVFYLLRLAPMLWSKYF